MFHKDYSLQTRRRIAYMSYGDPEIDVTLYRHVDAWTIHRGNTYIAMAETYREAKAIFLELTQR